MKARMSVAGVQLPACSAQAGPLFGVVGVCASTSFGGTECGAGSARMSMHTSACQHDFVRGVAAVVES